MTAKSLAARSAALRTDAERLIRAILPRPQQQTALPRILAALALATAGAVAALLLTPKTGAETRAIARRRFAGLRRRTNAFAREAARSDKPARRSEATN
ncbi:MAG TPA: hypothetical protein VMR31_06210 [Myxococcota bacterium]|nr:hypothetical protein [Myxococcota bacterium]